MADTYRYKRVLLKLSGEALAGEAGFGVDVKVLDSITRQVKELVDDGIQIAIVIGGGNYFRGATGAMSGMDRVQGDYVGMLATLMNAVMIKEYFSRHGVAARAMSAIQMPEVAETYISLRAIRHLEDGEVVICGGGTGSPFFTTDTTAALRACEMKCDCMMKATKVDGVYDSDPMKNPDAQRYDNITYQDVLAKNLRVMDSAAISLCMDNKMPLMVFSMKEEGNIKRALLGEHVGTIVE